MYPKKKYLMQVHGHSNFAPDMGHFGDKKLLCQAYFDYEPNDYEIQKTLKKMFGENITAEKLRMHTITIERIFTIE